ncbi:lymphocyte antigen 6D [Arvicanthis niloticus]|uniref:lymphocyte antigen 6D n=1 Tax=Arvicanthis niloticus TaxID=61156 RepID=UPI0014864485|nr:lymphocyte antigen 6D [Arvicanthis niloticus]
MFKMKKALLLLLVLAVATSPAWALQCHVCTSSTNCRKPQVCPANSYFCKTVITVEPLSGNLVRKECASLCTSNNSQQGHVSSGSEVTQCCQGDLCNHSLSSAAPAHALLSSGILGLTTSLGLLTVTALCL